MKKLKQNKYNKKGFVLMEVLAVTVVILVIFTAIFTMFVPTKGEYEQRIDYNHVSAQYAAFYMRKIYIDEEIPYNGGSFANNSSYVTLYDGNNCNNLDKDKEEYCESLAKELDLKEVILTTFNISKLKLDYNGEELKDYINYLPNYDNYPYEKEEVYRIILKTGDDYYASMPLYTEYQDRTVTIKQNPGGNLTVYNDTKESSSSTSLVAKAEDILRVVVTTNPGYTFNYVSFDGNDRIENNGMVVMKDENVTIEGIWSLTNYNITINSGVGGSINLYNLTQDKIKNDTAHYRDVIELRVSPDSGYKLVDGSLSVKSASGKVIEVTDNKFTMPLEGVTITASFESSAYNLVINPAGGSYNGKTTATIVTKGYGETLTVNNPTPESYKVTYNANGGSISKTEDTYSKVFDKWALTGGGSLNGVTYTFGSSNATLTASYKNGTDLTLPTPTRKGYTFKGWYNASSGGEKVGDASSSYSPSTDITLYAQWEVNTYKVSYNANGGTGTMSSHNATYNQSFAIKSNTFTRTGYSFVGWTTNSNGSDDGHNWTGWSGTWSYVDGEYGISGGELKLYARWKANTYTITYDYNYLPNDIFETTYNTSSYTACCQSGSISSTSTTFGTSGKTFTVVANKQGWYFPSINSTVLTVGSQYTFTFEAKASSAITANIGSEEGGTKAFSIGTSWARYSHTFTVTSSTYKSFHFYNWATASSNVTLEIRNIQIQKGTLNTKVTSLSYDSTLGTLETPTRAGYTFNGWYTAPIGGTKITSATAVPADNTTYYAQWTANSYYFDVNPASGIASFDITVGGTTSTGQTDYYQQKSYGTEFTITNVKAKTGYTYTGYTISGTTTALSGSSNSSIKVKLGAGTGAVALNATLNSYTVTYDYSTNGGTSATTTSASVNHGSGASLSPTATKSGWSFVGWNTSSTATTGLSSYTVTGNTKLYAIFKKTVTITFNKNGATSIGSSSLTCDMYNTATSCNITAPTITRANYSIIGWNTSSSAKISGWDVGVSKAFSANATYNAITSRTFTLTYNANGGSGSTSSSSCTVYNTTGSCSVSLRESGFTRSEYTWYAWSTSSSATDGSKAGDSLSISANTTVYAIWTNIVLSCPPSAYLGDEVQCWAGTTGVTMTCSGIALDSKYSTSFTTTEYDYGKVCLPTETGTLTVTATKNGQSLVAKVPITKAPLLLDCPTSANTGDTVSCYTNYAGVTLTCSGVSLDSYYNTSYVTTDGDMTKQCIPTSAGTLKVTATKDGETVTQNITVTSPPFTFTCDSSGTAWGEVDCYTNQAGVTITCSGISLSSGYSSSFTTTSSDMTKTCVPTTSGTLTMSATKNGYTITREIPISASGSSGSGGYTVKYCYLYWHEDAATLDGSPYTYYSNCYFVDMTYYPTTYSSGECYDLAVATGTGLRQGKFKCAAD